MKIPKELLTDENIYFINLDLINNGNKNNQKMKPKTTRKMKELKPKTTRKMKELKPSAHKNEKERIKRNYKKLKENSEESYSISPMKRAMISEFWKHNINPITGHTVSLSFTNYGSPLNERYWLDKTPN